MKTSLQYPTHDYPDARAFKAEKRKHLRAVKRALDDLRNGCAYFPDGTWRIEAMTEHVEALTKDLSAKEWGR